MRPPILTTLVLLAACTSATKASPTPSAEEATPAKPPLVTASSNAVAYFAGGCFWGVEHFLEELEGVAEVDSGYMGGKSRNPSYKEVSTGASGHLETVRVRYNSQKISYRAITKRFFEIHDPTQTDGQGPDLGSQYLSAVFYANPEEKSAAQSLIKILIDRQFKVVTKLLPVSDFWPAEEYHQDYYEKSGKTPYCHAPVYRFDPE